MKNARPCFAAAVLPGVRDAVRHEYARTGSASAEFIANFEAEFPTENEHHLIAAVVKMEICFGARRGYFLERHYTLSSLLVKQFERGGSARRHIPHGLLSRQCDQAFGIHNRLLPQAKRTLARLSGNSQRP
jgi:hypothetical protein